MQKRWTSLPVPPITPTGVRRPTMQDVAVRAGVSRTLVSLILRGARGAGEGTRARVLGVADELGYRPDTAAQLLRRSRSRHIGVLFDPRQALEVDVVEAIYNVAEKYQYSVVLSAMTLRRDAGRAIDELLGFRAEALLVTGSHIPPLERERLVQEGIPVVLFGKKYPPRASVDVVHFADGKGVVQVVDYLITLGHMDIVHVDGGMAVGAADRRRGYRSAMHRHGLDSKVHILPGDYTAESGARAADHMLHEAKLPTAVIAGNDDCAFGLLETFVRAQVRVPEQVSLVGYDDSSVARLPFVGLTSVRQDPEKLAAAAVQSVVERLDHGRSLATRVVFSPELVIRGTTAPPRLEAGGSVSMALPSEKVVQRSVQHPTRRPG
jgi:DNA-binding LacI/PurR family transcriptional regulator